MVKEKIEITEEPIILISENHIFQLKKTVQESSKHGLLLGQI